MKGDKQERLVRVNRLIEVIGTHGRRFFNDREAGGLMAYFELRHMGQVWFIDSYTRKPIYTHYKGKWKHFTGGGTLKCLCGRFRDYIQAGTLLPSRVFGPWPDWYCGGDLWGYGNQIEWVRAAAHKLGIVDPAWCPWHLSQSDQRPRTDLELPKEHRIIGTEVIGAASDWVTMDRIVTIVELLCPGDSLFTGTGVHASRIRTVACALVDRELLDMDRGSTPYQFRAVRAGSDVLSPNSGRVPRPAPELESGSLDKL